jgi:hypothetical protein
MLRRTILTCARASGMQPDTVREIEMLLERVAATAPEKADA